MVESIVSFIGERADWVLAITGLGAWMEQLPLNERMAFQFGSLLIVYALARAPFLLHSYRSYRATKVRIENIQSSKVVGVEMNLAVSVTGVELVGRADEVRQFKSGVLIVGDIKTRNNWTVLPEDVHALSIYRYLLKHGRRGSSVSGKGYIRFVNPDTGAEAFREVSLYNDAWVEDKIKLYAAVMNGTRVLHQMANVSQCGKCEFVSACYGVRDDDDGDDGRVEPLLCDDGFSDSAPGWSVGRIGI